MKHFNDKRPLEATTAMHPAQSWRDGYNDAIKSQPFGHTMNGYRTVRGASTSEMYYADGYSNGSVRLRSGW